ncbi:MAG TPA: hypothetical protein VNX15_09785 [Gemmatimonadales bacterium]|jgi:hypothetical protein|nr:hypothetical protein [Gemmatimonadales bacterium]
MRLSVRWLALVPAVAAFVACHDTPTPTGLTTAPDLWASLTMDDAATDYPSWGGLDLLRDAGGVLHLSVVEHEFGRLQYGECSGSCANIVDWHLATIDSGPYQGFGENASSVITSAGMVTVYEDQPGGTGTFQVKIAACAAQCDQLSNWQKADLFPGLLGSVNYASTHARALAADPSGGLHVLFHDADSNGVWYATCAASCQSGAAWHAVPLDTVGGRVKFAGTNQSILVDSHSTVHVFLESSDTTEALRYFECAAACDSASSWHAVVLAHGYTGRTPSVALAGTRLAVAFHDRLPGSTVPTGLIRYGTCDSNCLLPDAWSMRQLPTLAGPDVALAFDAAGRPWVATSYGTASHYNGYADLSRCAVTCTSLTEWTTFRIDSLGDGGDVSLILDPGGTPHIAVSGMGVHYSEPRPGYTFQ